MNVRRPALAALLLAGALMFTGCSAISGLVHLLGGAARDEEGAISKGGDLEVTRLAVGDCFDDVDFDVAETTSITAIPCDQEHVYETFYDFTLPDGDYPSVSAIEDATYAECTAAFEDYVGLSYEESSLDYFYFSPTEDGWNNYSDRTVSCIIGSEGVRVTGSVAGAAR